VDLRTSRPRDRAKASSGSGPSRPRRSWPL
jgi:hypothetical protein